MALYVSINLLITTKSDLEDFFVAENSPGDNISWEKEARSTGQEWKGETDNKKRSWNISHI